MNTKEKLAKLNELHKILGRKQFTSWKESVAKLEARIAKAQQEVDLRNTEVKPTNTELDMMIDRYNEQRKVMGYKAITSWAGTRDELASAITKLKADHLEMIRTENALTKQAKKLIKKIKTRKTVPATKVTSKPTSSALPGIATELGINQKVARTKLRKAFKDWKSLTAKEIRDFLKR